MQRSDSQREELILPFAAPRDQIPRATLFRSTVVVASLQALREHGYYERYLELLRGPRDEILSVVGGTWLPMPIAKAHYEACDALGLTKPEQFEMGHVVGDRAKTSWFSTALKGARGAGASPWSLAPFLVKLHERTINAGGVAAYRLGPKDARIEYVGNELLDVPYVREATRGMLHAVAEMFCARIFSHDLPGRRPGEALFRLQWA